MTPGNWKPKLPEWSDARCIICGEKINGPEYIASKPRKGPIIYAHTHCYEKEQEDRKEGKA